MKLPSSWVWPVLIMFPPSPLLPLVTISQSLAPQRLASRKDSHEKRKFWIHPLFSTKSYHTYLARVGLIILESQMNPQLMLRENLVSSLSWSRSWVRTTSLTRTTAVSSWLQVETWSDSSKNCLILYHLTSHLTVLLIIKNINNDPRQNQFR